MLSIGQTQWHAFHLFVDKIWIQLCKYMYQAPIKTKTKKK